jgi:hypothetical protein
VKTSSTERPILFSGAMVRAILAGTKTQTRRGIRPSPHGTFECPRFLSGPGHSGDGWYCCENDYADEGSIFYRCPYGVAGDRLWVREAFYVATPAGADMAKPVVFYKTQNVAGVPRWKPSIHMKREYSRLTLEIAGVRVQRLQDMSEEDAKAEGVEIPIDTDGCPPGKGRPMFDVLSPYRGPMETGHAYRWEFAKLWDSFDRKPSEKWAGNPWVWVVEFRRVDA